MQRYYPPVWGLLLHTRHWGHVLVQQPVKGGANRKKHQAHGTEGHLLMCRQRTPPQPAAPKELEFMRFCRRFVLQVNHDAMP